LERAEFYLAQIFSQKKKQGLSHYHLGIYFETVQDLKTARFHLTQAIKKLTDPAIKAAARKRLKALKKHPNSPKG
jgi:hypothetical protein